MRLGLTYNRSLPSMFLAQLARDDDPDIRYAMAENPRLHVLLLLELSQDENPYVAHRAQKTMSRTTPQPATLSLAA